MNLKLEACQKCPIQCAFEEKSTIIVEQAKQRRLSGQDVREKISKMSLEATRIGCPSGEISRLRTETLVQVDPRLKDRQRITIFPPKPSETEPFYYPQSDGPYLERGRGTPRTRRGNP